MDNLLVWLQSFYNDFCNGDWEHSYGFNIKNIDNPGWSVDFELAETFLDDVFFKEIAFERAKDDWVFCRVEKSVFKARGGTGNLYEMLSIFKDWVDSHESKKDAWLKEKEIYLVEEMLSWIKVFKENKTYLFALVEAIDGVLNEDQKLISKAKDKLRDSIDELRKSNFPIHDKRFNEYIGENKDILNAFLLEVSNILSPYIKR